MEKEFFFSLDPSHQLILLCSRIKVDEKEKKVFEKIIESEEFDWNKILDDAFKNSTLPFIYFHLKGLGLFPKIPGDIRDKLEKFHHFNTARNAWILLSLEKLSETFNRNKIPFLLIQGSCLLADVYSNPSLRYLSDIDVLIREDKLSGIEDILAPLGWVMSNYPGDRDWCLKNLNHFPLFYREKEPVALEIHFKLPYPEGKEELDCGWIWEKTCKKEIRSSVVYIPSPESMILHLSMHISKKSHINDLTMLLRHCCDISAILERYGEEGIDIDALVNTASSAGLSDALYHSIKVSNSIIGADFLDRIIRRISKDVSRETKEFSEFVSICLMQADKSIKIPLDGMEQFFSQNGISNKIKFIFKNIFFPPLDFMEKEYGISKFENRIYIYYLLRPFFLIKKLSWTRAVMAYRIARMKK